MSPGERKLVTLILVLLRLSSLNFVASQSTAIANKSATLSDCETHSSCTKCVSSSLSCDWCVENHKCTHDAVVNCPVDIPITKEAKTGPYHRIGYEFCPRINAEHSSEILIPSGLRKMIRTKVYLVGQLMVLSRFGCRFEIEGRKVRVVARILGDTVYCDETEFSYSAETATTTVPISVSWAGGSDLKTLDNPENIHAVLYRCKYMANDCVKCHALDDKYNCGWCQSSNTCEIRDQCDHSREIWLQKNMGCPNPSEIRSGNYSEFE